MTTYSFTHRINGDTVSLVSIKDEHGNIGISYANDADERLGSPWQYIDDRGLATLKGALQCLEAFEGWDDAQPNADGYEGWD